MDKKLTYCLLIIIATVHVNCFLTQHDDVFCNASCGLVFVNNSNDTMNISIKRLADSAKSAVLNISKSELILLPNEKITDSILYSWKGVDDCMISNVSKRHGLNIIVKHNQSVIIDRVSYPVNDQMGSMVVAVNEIQGFICDTIIIE